MQMQREVPFSNQNLSALLHLLTCYYFLINISLKIHNNVRVQSLQHHYKYELAS